MTVASGPGVVNWAERQAERGLDGVWHALRRRPYLGMGLAGGAAFAAAVYFGPAEIAFAVGIGYATYLILKKDESPSQAIKDTRVLEEGLGA